MNDRDNPQTDKSGIDWLYGSEILDSSHTNSTDRIPFPLSFLVCYYRSNPIIIHVKEIVKIFLFSGKVCCREYLSELSSGLLKILFFLGEIADLRDAWIHELCFTQFPTSL